MSLIRRRPAALSLATLAALALAASGCAVDDGETRAALQSAEDRLAQAEDRISELEADASDRVDLGQLRQEAEGALEEADQRAAEVVEDLTRSLPSGSDIVDVEALREDGKVVIEYGRSALEADPQVLEDTMREAAEQARNAIPNLEDVEFRVGDRTFTF